MYSQQTSFIATRGRGRGNRRTSPQEKEPKSKLMDILNTSYDTKLQTRQDNKSKAETSFLHGDDDNDKDSDKQEEEKAQTIIEKEQDQKEQDESALQPDKSTTKDNKLDQSNWDDNTETGSIQNTEEKRQTKSRRGNRSKQKKQESSVVNPDHQLPSQGVKRGNRGNRQTQSTNQGYGRGNRKPYYTQKNGYNNNNDRNYNDRDNGGYRGRGGYNRGRGNFNRSYGDRNDYGNRQYNNRDYNNNDNSTTRRSNEESENLEQSTYKPNFNKKPRYYQNQDGNNNRSYQQYSKPVVQTIQKIIEKEVIVEKEVQKIVYKTPERPPGRRVCPEVSMLIRGCKITLACRALLKMKADLLVIPYKTAKLELYPGGLISSCAINYKAKIKQKGDKLQKQGSVYMQKCMGLQNFQALAFIRINNTEASLKVGIPSLLKNIKDIVQGTSDKEKNVKFQSIIFPLSQQLGQAKAVITAFVNELEKYSNVVKDVYIMTEQPKTFCEAVSKFNEVFMELFEENEISVN